MPLSVIVAWIAGIQMDLDFKLIETGSLFVSVIVTAFTLQVHTHTTYSPFSSLMNIQANNHFAAFAGWFVTLPQGDPSAAVLHCDRCMLLCYEATCKYVGSFHRTDWDLHSVFGCSDFCRPVPFSSIISMIGNNNGAGLSLPTGTLSAQAA